MERNITVIPAKKRSHSAKSTAPAAEKIRLAAYCRVSTDHEEQTSSFENQKEYYSKYVDKHKEYELAGIYADEGITATNTKKRDGFNQMIADCEEGKIDKVITKSISRFARNTQDCLYYSRKLKELRIPIIFEKEGINTMDASGELLFTILSSLAQEESRNISENCKWAIRHNFQKGKPTINTKMFMGYDKDENGKLIINKEQAKIVKRIYKLFEEGYNCSQISNILKREGVKGTKADTWPSAAIKAMLQNEKYCGDTLMQKTYTVDFLSKKKVKNHGEVDQYFMEDSHEAIIPKDEWQAVQMEFERRDVYREEIGLYAFGNDSSPFSGRLVCSHCGKPYRRCGWSRNGKKFWMCASKKAKDASACSAENIFEESIVEPFRVAWNGVVANKDNLTEKWDDQIENGNPLERLRAKQMKMLIAEGQIQSVVPEHVILVLERIIAYDKRHFEVRFLDGTVKQICISE